MTRDQVEIDFSDLDIGLPVSNPIANVYFHAARDLALDTEIISERHGVGSISHGDKSLLVFGRWINLNDITSSTLCGHKRFSADRLRQQGLPVPDFVQVSASQYATRPEKAKLLIDSANGRYPLCIKPVSGSHGAQVVPDIRDEEELLWVLYSQPDLAQFDTLIESQIEGRHYRLIVALNEVIGCVERIPPFVTGDGRTSLSDLVKQFNTKRSAYNIEPATLGSRQCYVIKRRYNLEPADIPATQQMISLDDRCNLKVGGSIHYVDVARVSAKAKAISAEAASLFGLQFAGLDLIGDDITCEGSWVINEVNSQPAAHVPVPTMTREQRLSWPKRLMEIYFEL